MTEPMALDAKALEAVDAVAEVFWTDFHGRMGGPWPGIRNIEYISVAQTVATAKAAIRAYLAALSPPAAGEGLEPVAWRYREKNDAGVWQSYRWHNGPDRPLAGTTFTYEPLYATPAARAAVLVGYVNKNLLQAIKEQGRTDDIVIWEEPHASEHIPLYGENPMPAPTHRHKKRGTLYELIGIGRMQTKNWYPVMAAFYNDFSTVEVAIYRSIDDGSLWVRLREEFEDGRFETLTAEKT